MSVESEATTVSRSLLFVPGNRPDRFDKAAGCGSDAVILDLEDAVAAETKDQARRDVVAWLESGGSGLVRINAPGTPWYEDDIRALRQVIGASALSQAGLLGLVVPKAEPGAELASLGKGEIPLVPLIETAVGILDARKVAMLPAVRRLALGSFDLAVQIGIDPGDPVALAAARQSLVLASAAANLPAPVDGVYAELRDTEGLRQEAVYARRLGFGGKLCIHPNQVGTVTQMFSPTEDEIAWAMRIVKAGVGAGSVAAVEGQMVDRPVVERAHRILSRHEQAASQ